MSGFHYLFIILALSLSASAGDLRTLSAEPPAGKWISRNVLTMYGEQDYRIYLPSIAEHQRVPVVVALHGCHMNPEIFEQTSHLNVEAEKNGYAVIYPEQPILRNGEYCWNWFLPIDQVRGMGEPALIMSALDDARSLYPLDSSRTYVAGISAGAAMANILAACYSDVFAAVASLSGIEYLQAMTLEDAEPSLIHGPTTTPMNSARTAFLCSGNFAGPRYMPAFLMHGTLDQRVYPLNANDVIAEYVDFNDLLDDGKMNGSFPHQPNASTGGQVPGGYAYQTQGFVVGGKPIVEMTWVQGMAHAWSGGTPGMKYADPKGPNASQMILNFFSQYSR